MISYFEKQLAELYEAANRDTEDIKKQVQGIVPTYLSGKEL